MATNNILKEIVAAKLKEVDRAKIEYPLPQLKKLIDTQSPALNLSGALMGDTVRIIAEIKKASPTKGVLKEIFIPSKLASSYVENGAAAISVLTNSQYFQGTIQDMKTVCGVSHQKGIPVVRKEFIIDPYQVYEARAYGADAILLIVGILTPQKLNELISLAQGFWMQCLVEIHNEEELCVAIEAGAEIIGINNRDLRSFKTDLKVTERLAPLVPNDKIVVSESGISSKKDVMKVGNAGAQAVLIGETLLTAADPGTKLRELL